jgi:hypothetical protein
MTIDTKLRPQVSPSTISAQTRAATTTPSVAKAAVPTLAAAPAPTGFAAASSFDSATRAPKLAEGVGDLAAGRQVKGGVADDSVGAGDLAAGRKTKGGVADDSVGAGDLAAGRKTKGGVADDSVGVNDLAAGRKTKGGVADDSVGVNDPSAARTKKGGVADDSVGVTDPSAARTKKGGVADDTVGFDAVRDSLVGPVNDPAYLKIRNDVYNRLESPSYLSGSQPPAPVDQQALGHRLASLLPAQAATLQKVAQDPQAAANINVVTNAPVNVSARNSMIQTVAADAKGVVGTVVAHIAQSPLFLGLAPAQQQSVANVLAKLNPDGMKLMGALVQQSPDVLKTTDSQGHSLLSNLEQLATQPLNSALYGKTTSADVMTNVLREVVNPNRIEQGTAPTCTVTSMQFELVGEEPAEYTRLLAGLTGPSGKATMVGGGDLVANGADITSQALDGRPVTQALFQSAAMEFANGSTATFDPVAGTTTDAKGNTYAGLKPTQQTVILKSLFGVKYTTQTLYNEADGQKALNALQGYDSSKHMNRPVILEIDQGAINHAVTLESIADGKVTFRDPYGVLRSMPQELFPKYVVAVHKPVDLPAA